MTGTTTSLRVDPSNVATAAAWDGEEGAYWAAHAPRFDDSLGAYHRSFLAAAHISGTDRVLDIGCGTGQTTRDAARLAASGSALGVDLSADMLALARRLAGEEGVRNAWFEQADAQIHPFEAGGFDVVISRTGTMFFGDQVAAFTNLADALRPGGRLTLLVWQGPDANEWIREIVGAFAAGRALPAPQPGASGPFAFADPAHATSVLTAAGFTDITLHPMRQPMYFGPDADTTYPFLLGLMAWMLDGLDEVARQQATDALRATITRHAGPNGVTYDSAAWLITARRL
ncbi:MAG: class I SAM-dependent methyltransferase [Mycobacteriaceae bacterium]